MTKKMSKKRSSVGIRATSDKATSEIEAAQSATLSLSKVSGGFLSNYPVVFTKDSNYFFCCASTCIKIYSVATGGIVRTLSTSPDKGGHSDIVTCVMLNPKNALQLLSASLDGTVKLWDFNDSILLKTYRLGFPVTHMTIHASNPKFVYVVTNKVSTNKVSTKKMSRKKESTEKEEQNMATKSDGDKINSVLLRFSLEAQIPEPIRMLKTRQCTGLQISHDGSFLSIASRFKLHVWKVDHETRDFEFKTYISQERITCLAFHPTEACIATGDRIGRITLWYCLTPTKLDRPVTSKLHWHAHKVNHLAFTADGVYLLSGGEEAVLVLWQLETGHKQFLPRLGSEIRSITVSPDQSLYALGHLDNSVRIVNALNLDIKQAILGLKYAQTDHIANPLSTGLVIEPRNHHVVLNGVPGTLQFYNAYTDRHVLELEVTSRNMVSRTDDKEIVQPHVDFVAFWGHGEWMATVDSRDDGVTTPELYLKFWSWDPDAQSYTLNTRVDAPHTEPITSLAFHPGSARGAQPMAITTSFDKDFKIWQLVMQPGVGKNNAEVSESAWACRSVGVYRNYVPHHATFSEDGSILAVAYGQIVTLWDPYTNTFQGVLVHPPENRAVKRVEFLGGNSPFLVSVTQDHLYVWNLLTCKVWWSYQIKVDHLAINPQSSHFIVANNFPLASQCRFLVFDPRSPFPVLIHNVSDKCLALTYLPQDNPSSSSDDQSSAFSALGRSNVLFLNEKWDLQVFGQTMKGDKDRNEANKNNVSLLSATPAPKSYFSDIFGTVLPEVGEAQQRATAAAQKQAAAATAAAATARDKGKGADTTFDLLSAPAHVMPSVELVFESFMEGLLGKAGTVKKEDGRAEEGGKEDSDDDMGEREHDDEDQMDVDTVAPTASAPSTLLSAPITVDDSSEQEVALATKGDAFGFLADHFLRQLTAGDQTNGNGGSKAPSQPTGTKTNGVLINGKANGVSAYHSDNSEMELEAEKVTAITNGKIPAPARTPKKGMAEERARAGATPKSTGKKRKQ